MFTIRMKLFDNINELEVFEINGKKADIDDFGQYNVEKSKFYPKLPTSIILSKYDINVDNYKVIAELLENSKLKQTLTEIKKICENNDELQGDFNLVDCDKYKLGKHNLAKKILQKISECEAKND